MVKASASQLSVESTEVYCHHCTQVADNGRLIHHAPPACGKADDGGKSTMHRLTKEMLAALESSDPDATLDSDSFSIVDPTSPGELISRDDADALIDAYERIDAIDKQLYLAKQQIREALGNLTTGDAKTRRIAGKRRMAKVEFPSDSYEQSILKEAWQSYPQFREAYLRIERLATKAVECKKLVNTSGPADLETFKGMIEKANKGPQGLPTIKVEK